MPPPPSNHRKQPSFPVGLGALPHHHHQHYTLPTRRPARENRPQQTHPPVANFFLDIQDTPAPRLSAASIIPIPPSVRQSTVTTVSDSDDIFRSSPVAPDVPALPVLPVFYKATGAPSKPTEAERYKQRYLNRRTLPAPASSTSTAFPGPPVHHKGRARTQSLGSVSVSSSSTTGATTGEPQRSTTGHYHKRSPSNPTLAAIEERPLPEIPRRRVIITTPDSRDPPSNTHHVHFTTTQPSKSVPHTGPSDPPRLARTSDESRPSTTTSPNTVSGSPTSTLVHPSPLYERQPSPTKFPSKKRMFPPLNSLNFFKRDRSASVGCSPTTNSDTNSNSNEHHKRSTTPTPSKFASLPAISTSRISRPIARSTSASTPMPRHRARHHHGELSAAVKRVRRVTPLTEVDMYSKKNWRGSVFDERKVPEYTPPADSLYAR